MWSLLAYITILLLIAWQWQYKCQLANCKIPPIATNNNLMYHVLCSEIQTQTGSNERLFILTRTYSVHIFREFPFIKPQNDT